VGAVLSQENLKTPAARDCAAPATAVIVQVDGGHIPLKQQDKRSFEALSGVVYRPESIRRIDHHREINSKSFALSAEDDHLPRWKRIYSMRAEAGEARYSSHSSGWWSLQLLVCDLESPLTANNCSASWIGFTSLRSFRMLGAVDEAYIETLERSNGPYGMANHKRRWASLNFWWWMSRTHWSARN